MQRAPQRVRLSGFCLQHVEIRQVRIPFDQRRDIAEAPQGRSIEVPYRIADRRTVRIDEQLLSVQIDAAESGKMKLLDDASRNALQVLATVEFVVVRGDVDVIEIQQNAAARFGGNAGDEFPLRYRRCGELQIARHIFEQD